MSPSSSPRCFLCNSTYKVSPIDGEEEDGKPIYCCSGFCRDKVNKAQKIKLVEEDKKVKAPAKAVEPAPATATAPAPVPDVEPEKEKPKPEVSAEAPSDTTMATPVSDSSFSVGSFVRAVWVEDGVEYEGTISEFGDHEGTKYAMVEFIGYGNSASIWMTDLMESKGPAARNKQRIEAGGTATETEEPKEATATPAWKEGDFARAVYTDDGIEYEGVLLTLGESDGNKYAIIEFVGYKNQQSTWLESLLPSQGEEARREQRRAAGEDVPEEEIQWKQGDHCRVLYAGDKIEYEGKISKLVTNEAGKACADIQFYGYSFTQVTPLDQIMESHGKEARKEQDAEGKADEAKKKAAEEKRIAEGKAAADKAAVEKAAAEKAAAERAAAAKKDAEAKAAAERAAKAKEAEAKAAAERAAKAKEAEAKSAAERAAKAKEAEAQAKKEADAKAAAERKAKAAAEQEAVERQANRRIAEEKAKQAAEAEAAKKAAAPKYVVGDKVRAIYAVDSLEYEGTIKTITNAPDGGAYALVEFLGYGNEETVWVQDLKPSAGDESRTKQEKEAAASVTPAESVAAPVATVAPQAELGPAPVAAVPTAHVTPATHNLVPVDYQAIRDENERLKMSVEVLREANIELYRKVDPSLLPLPGLNESEVDMKNMQLLKLKNDDLARQVTDLKQALKDKERKLVDSLNTAIKDSKELIARVEGHKRERDNLQADLDEARSTIVRLERDIQELRNGNHSPLNSSVEELPRMQSPSVNGGNAMMPQMFPMVPTSGGDGNAPMMMCMMPMYMPATQGKQLMAQQQPQINGGGSPHVHAPLRRPFTNGRAPQN